ncbi:SDR family oxidoreductase [Priestia flexa]|uniref:SDR family oxidoreductase n=1 Tax=Priestia flexa TaxID=86664 RepID=UPI0039B418B0
MTLLPLENKVAVVTGGAGVLGAAFSAALAKAGAKVAILNRTLEKAEALADQLNQEGGQALAVSADVTNEASLKAAKEIINRHWGEIDLLVNGAGGNHPKATTTQEYFSRDAELSDNTVTFFNLEPDDVRFVMDLNFMGTLLPTQVFAADMIQKEAGTIINISSMNGFTPLTKIPAYSGSKAAINNLTQWLAVHFATSNIRVNAIAPGFFLTAQNEKLLLKEDGTPTDRAKKIVDHTPMGRFGDKEDLVGTLLYLADDSMSRFVTGAVIPVDGGFSAYSGV